MNSPACIRGRGERRNYGPGTRTSAPRSRNSNANRSACWRPIWPRSSGARNSPANAKRSSACSTAWRTNGARSRPRCTSSTMRVRITRPPLPSTVHSSLRLRLAQSRLQFLDGRQAPAEVARQRLQQCVGRDPNRLGDIAQRVLCYNAALPFAQDQSDAWLVVRMPQQVVGRRQVEVHFAGELRLEVDHLDIDGHVAAQADIV